MKLPTPFLQLRNPNPNPNSSVCVPLEARTSPAILRQSALLFSFAFSPIPPPSLHGASPPPRRMRRAPWAALAKCKLWQRLPY